MTWGVPIIIETIGIIFACVVGIVGLAAIKKVMADFGVK